jgi:hypothetical protein
VTQASTHVWNPGTPCSIREPDPEDPEKATAEDAEGPSAACGRNQNSFSRQDAKSAKKTGL